MPLETGRRLCLLAEVGRTRVAIEATLVVEVASPDPNGESLRGALELKDLSRLLGGEPEVRPGVAVVFDVSPTLAVRVARVLEVADVSVAPSFLLPPGLGEVLALTCCGALVHRERLYLELLADALPHQPGRAAAAPDRAVLLADAQPERALLFESQGQLFGVPLPLVQQVVTRPPTFSPLPVAQGPVAGLFPHGNTLWPLVHVPAMLGRATPQAEELFVLTELAGQSVALSAARVLGVYGGLEVGEGPGEYRTPGGVASALFLDLQRMFS